MATALGAGTLGYPYTRPLHVVRPPPYVHRQAKAGQGPAKHPLFETFASTERPTFQARGQLASAVARLAQPLQKFKAHAGHVAPPSGPVHTFHFHCSYQGLHGVGEYEVAGTQQADEVAKGGDLEAVPICVDVQ